MIEFVNAIRKMVEDAGHPVLYGTEHCKNSNCKNCKSETGCAKVVEASLLILSATPKRLTEVAEKLDEILGK